MTQYKKTTAYPVLTCEYTSIDEVLDTITDLKASCTACNYTFPGQSVTALTPHITQLYNGTLRGVLAPGTPLPTIYKSITVKYPEVIDPAEVLRLACTLGKRLLMRKRVYYGDEQLFEIKVVKFSPSYDHVKVQYIGGAMNWYNSHDYFKVTNEILEVLEDDSVPKVQDKGPASDTPNTQ
jgi:hypothetical protein